MLPGRKYSAEFVGESLRRRRWLAAVPLLLGILGGLLYSRSQPDLYRSQAVVQVVPQRVPESYVQSTVTERAEDRVRSLSQQVLSRTQLERTIIDFSLYPEERAAQPMEDVVELMTKRIQIEPLSTGTRRNDSTVDAFRIAFDYSDPRVAQKVVERLASYFIDENAKVRGSQADQTSQFLQAQLASARARLEAQEKKLEEFRQRNAGRLPTQMQTNLQAIQNTQLTLQATSESLARDRDRKLMLERLYGDAAADLDVTNVAGGQSATGVPGDLSSLPANATPQQRLDAARAALATLQLRLTPEHPDVVRMKRAIRDLERKVADDELQQPVSPEAARPTPPAMSQADAARRDKLRQMRAEIESLDRQIAFKQEEEARLRARIAQYQGRLEAVPGIESEWTALTRDYDTLQATYRELLAKSENSKMAESLEQRQIGEQFRILDPPKVPERRFGPNRVRINAIGVVAGLGLSVLLLGFTMSRDSTMRSETEVLDAIELPVLAMVPYVPIEPERVRQRRRLWMEAAAAFALVVMTGALVFFLQLWKFVV